MRELYQNESEMPTTVQHHEMLAATGNDPFYDRFPWFRLIGRCEDFCLVFFNLVDFFLIWSLLSFGADSPEYYGRKTLKLWQWHSCTKNSIKITATELLVKLRNTRSRELMQTVCTDCLSFKDAQGFRVCMCVYVWLI